jgi:hypothetical protein
MPSCRPWTPLSSVDRFVRTSAELWVLLGGYTGVIAVLLIVGLSLLRSHPSTLTSAYCLYMVCLQFYQLQSAGIGPAWIPGWPQGEAFALMQGLAAAVLVSGLGTAMVAFLRPHGALRLIIVGGIALAALAFIASAGYPSCYRIGARVMLSLAPAVLFMLVRGLGRNEPWVRWFAVGLYATIVGGSAQTAAIVFDGAGLNSGSEFRGQFTELSEFGGQFTELDLNSGDSLLNCHSGQSPSKSALPGLTTRTSAIRAQGRP